MPFIFIFAIYFIVACIILQKLRNRYVFVDRFFYAYSGSLCILLFALFTKGFFDAIGGETIRPKGIPGLLIGMMGLYFCFAHWGKMMDSLAHNNSSKESGWFLISALSGFIVGLTIFNSSKTFKNTGDFGFVILLATVAHLIFFQASYKISVLIKKMGEFSFFAPMKLVFPIFASIVAFIYTKIV